MFLITPASRNSNISFQLVLSIDRPVGRMKRQLSVKTAFINPSAPEVNLRIQFLRLSELISLTTNRLMLFRVIMIVSARIIKNTCGQSAGFWYVKDSGTYSYHCCTVSQSIMRDGMRVPVLSDLCQ